jgi:hypothetical protein
MSLRLLAMIIAWLCVGAYPIALIFGLEFTNPFYELPLLLIWFASVLFIYRDWRKGNWNA